ncbi:MAG: hypothetical protein N2202_01735 [Proteobacteria bacterium]|nr:hypothetical protein [Pseudomonadota bacterium]
MRKILAIPILIICLLFNAPFLYAITYQEFVKDIKTIFFSAKGKAVLFGYTQDFAFGEVAEGNLSVGSFVVIKGKPDMTQNVPQELYEDVAYGEVESIKGKYIKVFIIKRLKAIPKDSIITGLDKLYIHVTGDGDLLPFTSALIKEKDFVVLDKMDQKVLLKISAQKIGENNFGYKATLSPGDRIISIGNVAVDTRVEPMPIAKAIEKPVEKPAEQAFRPSDIPKVIPVQPSNTFIAKNTKTGNTWIADSFQVYCADCDDRLSKKFTLTEKPVYMFEENGIIYLWDDKGKTIVIDGSTMKKTIGYKIPEFFGNFDPSTKRILTDTLKSIPLPEDVAYVYLYKDGYIIAGKENEFLVFKDGSKLGSLVNHSAIFKIRQNSLFTFNEEQEEVPLAGTYYKLTINTYSLPDLKQTSVIELADYIKAFDYDPLAKEFIYLKKDGSIKKIKP